MELITRPLTARELFFTEPAILQVPYSLPSEILPQPVTAPVAGMQPPDLSNKQFGKISFLSKFGKLIEENPKTVITVALLSVGVTLFLLERCTNKTCIHHLEDVGEQTKAISNDQKPTDEIPDKPNETPVENTPLPPGPADNQ